MPNEDDHRLARNASRYLTTDRVTPPQSETYRRVLCSGASGDPMRDFLRGMSREEVERLTAGNLSDEAPPGHVERKLEALCRGIDRCRTAGPRG